MQEQFVLFYGGPFSQWHCVSNGLNFVLNGIKYNCVEQYMMSEKALLFGDQALYIKIMDAYIPREQKEYGRRVKGFDQEVWDKAKLNIVYFGNMAKYSQNKGLRNLLFATEGKTLAEASPYDKIWGVGLSQKNPGINNRKNWKGQNLLGETLTLVRDTLVLYNWVADLRVS